MEKIWMKDGEFADINDEQKEALTVEQLAQYTTDKSEHQRNKLIADFDEKLEDATKDFLKKEEIEKLQSDFNKTIKDMPIEALNKYVETIEALKKESKTTLELAKEIRDIAKAQGNEILALKNSAPQIPDVRRKGKRKDQIEGLIKLAFNSEAFTEFEGRGFKGSSNKMCLDQKDGKVLLVDVATKATVDTSDHTGNVMISEISDIVRDDSPTRRSHVRDLLNVSMTDQAQIVAGQVYDFTDALTLGAVMLAENAEAPESVFKSKEQTWTLKRIANSMRISKRTIKVNGLKWVMDKVLAKLPDATLFVEDVQLLFGDNVGNNVQGLANDAQDFDLAPNTYSAADFASVATYNAGVQALITFAAVHSLRNGDNLTIANASEGTYNATHTSIEVINTTQVIIDLTFVTEADTSAWTGSSTSPFYLGIDIAQEYDVLAVADAQLEAGEYTNTGFVIHPSQGTQIGLLKDTQGNYLNLSKDSSGRITGVNGKPVAYTTAMPYGKWLNGDFSRNGVELKEFTPLNIQFVEDVESVKKNEIVIVIEEEIIFPIYNPFWFIFGKFSTAKTQLETA